MKGNRQGYWPSESGATGTRTMVFLALAIAALAAIIVLWRCFAPPEGRNEYAVTIVPVKPASCQANPQAVPDVPIGSTFTFTNGTASKITITVPKGLFSATDDTTITLDAQATSSVYTVQDEADKLQPDPEGWMYFPDCQDENDARPRIVIKAASDPT